MQCRRLVWATNCKQKSNLILSQCLRKISEHLGKLPENTGKNGANVLWFEKKWRPTYAESHEDLFFFCHPKNGHHEKLFAQKAAKKIFFGQVWENSGKNLSHSQKFACSYTYTRRHPTCWASLQRSHTLSLAHSATEPGHLLHSALTCPSSGYA